MRRQGWWSHYAVRRHLVVGGLVLIAGGFQAMERFDIKVDWTWAHSKRVLFASFLVAGAAVLINTVGDVFVQKRALAGEGHRLRVYQAALACVVKLSTDLKISIFDIGANVFVVKKPIYQRTLPSSWMPAFLSGRTFRIGRRPRLDRIERVRLSNNPAKSAVVWTESKGVIGDCWSNDRPEHVLWAPLAKRWAGKTITDQQWAKIRPEDKAGLTLEDFVTMVGKYAEIKAVPIKDERGKIIGVLAVDRVWRSGDSQVSHLHTSGVEETVTDAASVLQGVLEAR